MQRAPKTAAKPRKQAAKRSSAGPAERRRSAEERPAAGERPPPEVTRVLAGLGLEEEDGLALHAQVARVLEAGARAGKRKGRGKARGLASHPPAADLDPVGLVPLVLAVRDSLKRGAPGGRGTRARDERLDRAADAVLCGLAERAGSAPARKAGGGRKEADAARELLQRVVALTPDAVVTIRASGRLGLWSAAASRLTGRRRWEVHRRGLAASFQDRAVFDRILEELEERGRVVGREVVFLNASGEEVPARIFGVRLKPAPGPGTSAPAGGTKKNARRGGVRAADPERYLLLFHDLSEVQHIRRRLIEIEKLSAMAKIAGSVAHEFRNPLNSLFLSADLLEDELEGSDAVRKSIAPTLAAIREEVERLNQIITHYLSLSKISSASPERLDLGVAAAAFAEEYAAHLDADEVELRMRSDGGGTDDADAHAITADPNQVRRILVNLVENAVDAVVGEDAQETGGSEAPRTRRGRVTIYVRRMRRSVKVTVKDNGPGIPEDLRERVFEPFFTSKAGGSGLGLYLVREIALASGGALSLSSATGRGTSISVRWPRAERAAAERADH